MKPAPFEYRAAGTLDEALALLDPPGHSIAPLAGGQSLVPLLNLRRVRPAVVLDLNRLTELAGVEVTGTAVLVGAMTRLHDLERHEGLRAALPVVPQTAARVAHRQIRHRATLGGSLCHADPAAQLAATAVALGATLRLRRAGGERTVPAEEFFTGPHRTVRRPDELLTAVSFPRRPGFRYRFESVTRRGGAGFPLVGVCVGVRLEAGAVAEARIAACGVADRPLRLTGAEQALAGYGAAAADGALGEVADAAVAGTRPPSDLHGSAGFRGDLLRAVLRRAAVHLLTEGS
ncbi:FAD binding domain-containing protein [Kitasatospora sp. NPDC059408]|uniref:FAD binding domain-containing protein n=1 Tax=Kitasatospora sp. NPDC059408 TaxID=3346823 RepID=UPI00368E628E